MVIGKVVGTIVTTISHRDYKNRRLLVVQPLGLEGETSGGDFIALDNSQAGVGDTVLVNREGNGARQVLNNPDGCDLGHCGNCRFGLPGRVDFL